MQEFVTVNFETGAMDGHLKYGESNIGDLVGFFEDEAARKALPQNLVVYQVQSYCPEAEGTEGGLFFGVSKVLPGLVGDEYFMTKGHFHAEEDTAEFYWGITGQGLLLCMDEQGRTTCRQISPGVLLYIPRRSAHRLVNTGNSVLTVGACWPSNAGHNYDRIRRTGFSVRVKNINGAVSVVPTSD